MGMYDREPNFEDHFKVGDRFVLTGMEYAGEINTRHGKAHKVLIQVVSREHPTVKRTYSALGTGFATLAQRASASDFPHVAEYIEVPLPPREGDREPRRVKRFAPVDVSPRDFIDGDDGPALSAEWHPDVLAAPNAGQIQSGDEGVGF